MDDADPAEIPAPGPGQVQHRHWPVGLGGDSHDPAIAHRLGQDAAPPREAGDAKDRRSLETPPPRQ
ncbi:hypothetical protein [Sinisalibacter lacisalsi]|uniref:hypothetical protein n=1 Tax=Sinisalibacter lacisalsi TaxID=1526570 RepID=UPI001664BCD9|nr:hypothetical protein [Sinisalibacter lacisalsi]